MDSCVGGVNNTIDMFNFLNDEPKRQECNMMKSLYNSSTYPGFDNITFIGYRDFYM